MKPVKSIVLVGLLIAAAAVSVQAQKLSIKGSNTFGEDLGPALIKDFQAKNPGLEITLETQGSGSGIQALLDNECDIASTSRLLNEDEIRLAKSRNIRFQYHVVGYYGIAVVVQSGHPVKALSDDQVEHIFAGIIKNWSQVGGPDHPIHVYIPTANAGTYLGFQELAMSRKPYTKEARENATYHELGQAVAADPYGIGFVSLTVMRDMSLQGMLINGIHPSAIAVIEGLYPYARMVRLVTNRDATSREARSFIRFAQSREGQKIVERTGFVPSMASAMDMGGLGP